MFRAALVVRIGVLRVCYRVLRKLSHAAATLIGWWAACLLCSCSDGSGGPPPCASDAECEPVCEADCAPERVVSAKCNQFLLACVCDCGPNGAGGQGGQGGAGGGECPGSMLRQELVPTEIECDPSMGVPPCDTECPSLCLDGGFELGSRGAACVSAPPTGSFCDCLCATCEPE